MKIKTLFTLLLLFTACVNELEDKKDADTRQKQASQIQPRPLFVKNKSRADLLNPRPVQPISSPQTFYFSATGATYVSVLIFNTNVGVTAEAFTAGNLINECIAGVSTLAGHAMTQSTALLSTDATNQFYKCHAANPNEPLSITEKFDASTLSGNYYWLVLGYDENRVLTHSSGLEKFTK